MPTGNTPSVASSSLPASQRQLIGMKYFLLLWTLFFAICFGLGYPTLKRYDPRTAEGMSDTYKYHAMTTGADTSSFREIFRCRILVPYVARPFYWFAREYLGTAWDAGFFGLLMANSLFCATTACIVVSIGHKLLKDLSVALLGATLYLLSFAIPNLQLAGLVDAGEACFLAALVWSLLTRRWYLLPVWGVLGALAKETFVPFSVVFAVAWWLMERREYGLRGQTFKTRERINSKKSEPIWIAALAFIGLATVVMVHSRIAGHFRWPWEIANDSNAGVNYVAALWGSFSERTFWYVFGWLLPFGIWRLKDFPKPWLVASITSSIVAVMLVMFINAGGNVARPLFNIVGPLLSLSVALLIARPSAYFAPTRPELHS